MLYQPEYTYAHNPDFTGNLGVFGANLLYQAMDLDGNLVRQWRNKGAFNGGELVGQSYVFNVVDVAKLLILKEVCGFDIKKAGQAADMGYEAVVCHALKRAPLLEAWGPSEEAVEALVELIRTDDEPLMGLFGFVDSPSYPDNFLVCGNGEDWETSYDISICLKKTSIVVNLYELSTRLIEVWERFGELNDPRPGESKGLSTIGMFEARWTGQPPVIRYFATDPKSPLIDPATGEV